MSNSINLHQYIDAVYVITLPQSNKRLERFMKAFTHFDHPSLFKFDAVDGRTLHVPDWPGNPGALGCRQSHIDVLKTARNAKHKRFIVFEDDAILPKDFQSKLAIFLERVPPDWDMIYLHAENHYIQPTYLNEYTMKLNSTLALVGILYHQKCLDTVIQKLENDLRWVDSCMADLHVVLNVYAPVKSLVIHANGFSTIEQKTVYHNKNFLIHLLLKGKAAVAKLRRLFN